jgi:hypothetical protein
MRIKYVPTHAEVQVQKKNHFTVTPINNIEHWRAEREKIEAQYHKEKLERFEKARASAMEIYTGEKQVELLSAMDHAEIAYVKSREDAKKPTPITWEQIQAKKADWDRKNNSERLAFAEGHYKRFGEYPKDITKSVSPKPSLFERAKRAVARFVRGAFPQ